jgi:ubiquinone/menaquinone biosynthesis C-methylase UbiE
VIRATRLAGRAHRRHNPRMGDGSSPKHVTEYFTGLASVYSEHRPTYPRAAIEWILQGLPAHPRVADMGCGTGISTRLLAEQGAQVVGIDPNSDMLTEARSHVRGDQSIEYRTGTGESTGLGAASVNLVVCAQSFHWFDARRALGEFHRIVRQGGQLALMWNIKTESEPFSAQFTRIMRAAQVDAEARGLRVPSERDADPTLDGYFANPRRQEFQNPQSLDLQGVLGRAHSASYFPRIGPLRETFERELTESFHRYQHDDRVMLVHITEVTLADRGEEKTPGRAGD